ncbi:hypothetical protein I3843_08G087600 [Carya illinoinensis]|nr:hypothetical protein I3843_08G087600 [Carya illinoinensis]
MMKLLELPLVLRMIFWVAVLGVAALFFHLYNTVWVKAKRIRKQLRIQGIKGPPPSFFSGNLSEMQKIQSQATKAPNHADQIVAHDYTSTLFPYFEQWRKEYGLIYTYSTGMRQHLYVNQPELVKEMNQCITLGLGKPSYVSKRLAPMLGNGILRSNGHIWAQQRKIVAPEFFMDKVKGMMGLMLESTQTLVRKWEDCIEAQGGMAADIQVDEDLKGVSAEVISRACFGSSYFKGKEIFLKLRSLQKVISKQGFLFGVTSFGTRKRKEIRNLEREIETLIWKAVQEREEKCLETSTTCEKDLMQSILEGAMNDQSMDKDSSKRFIVDNCKNIYFAGHESTAVAASWCLMLLALHPEWQARIRTEVAQLSPNGLADINSILQLKTV